MIKGWTYYNHALRPNVLLHEKADVSGIDNPDFWKFENFVCEKIPLFARWITDFDCGYETSWWNVILDKPFNIETLKSKRRYEIKKGDKFFYVHLLDYSENIEEIYSVYKLSLRGVPKHIQAITDSREYFENLFNDLEHSHIFGAYFKENDKLEGFAIFRKYGRYIGFNSLKVNTDAEKYNVNFALINYALDYFKEELSNGCYIDDGARPILHTTTQFQEFLEKYFGFRKAYSHLHVKYRPGLGIIVKCLFPFRSFFKHTKNKYFQEIYGILLQEEFANDPR